MQGPVHIGPYRLRRAIATTPISSVWAAVHGPSQRAVAIKLLGPDATRDRRRIKAFRAELRQTASLANPNVVHLYESGYVDEVAARAGGGLLVKGAPYLVMELCTGGTLDEIKRPFRWSELKQVLVAMLDGLAHLHSRGGLHRGLRPSIVLLNGAADERQGIKLAGLGLGPRLDALIMREEYDRIGDALRFMAPEQVQRRWRDAGPWSDLYSLGCIAWSLVSGHRPFRGIRGTDLAAAQCNLPLHSLAPSGPVPDGFASWIDRLTTKDPHRRFQRAADATWALIRLGDVREDIQLESPDALVVALEDVSPTINPSRSGQFDLADLRARLDQTETLARFSTVPGLTDSELTVFRGTLSPDMPPVPASWRQAGPAYRWTQPPGTGLGLFDLRPLPLVDRTDERNLLWGALREVVQSRSARLVRITGRAGIGKSHLSQWLCDRASELGTATVLAATHAHGEAPGTSVRRMFQSFLRLGKLSRDKAQARIRNFLFQRNVRQLDEVEALTGLLYPSNRQDEGVRRISGVEERHAVIRRFFRLLALERPLVVFLEDAHWGNDALGLAYAVLESQAWSPMPVLFVLTTREETLATRPVERALLDGIDRFDAAQTLELGPLPEADRQVLAQQILGLEPALATRVADRAAGNPLLMVEIVRDWVHRGALEASPGGFVLPKNESVSLPDDLHEVWMRRAERVTRSLPHGADAYLQAAAVLGLEVDHDEWREVTDHPGGFDDTQFLEQGGMAFFPERARIRARLADRLLDQRLAGESERGWTFAHGMIREAILRQAREHGTLENLHRAAARMLRRRWVGGRVGIAERLGAHLLASGQLEEAIPALLQGIEERRSTLGVHPALALLAVAEQTMDRVRLPADDPRWGRLGVMRSSLAYMRGDHDEAERWARQVRLLASAHPWETWSEVMHAALLWQARIALRRGELTGAEQLFQQLRGSVGETRHPRMLALALHGLAAVARERGSTHGAVGLLGDARRAFEAADDTIGIADCWEEMANLDAHSGALDSAEDLFKRALSVYEQRGERQRIGSAIHGLAELARSRGDFGVAESGLRHALAVWESVGSAQAALARLALAMLSLQRGEYEEAGALAAIAASRFEQTGRRRLQGTAEVARMAAAAGTRDWEAVTEHLERAKDLARATAFCSRDAGWAAQKAGDLGIQQRRNASARAAYRFAWYQYRGIGDDAAVERLSLLLEPAPED